MARKPKPPSPQLGFFTLPSTQPDASVLPNPNRQPEGASVGGRVKDRDPPVDTLASESVVIGASVDLDSFDDYDDAAHVEGVPRLRLVDPVAPAPRVIVEAVGEGFEVSRLRDNGSTVACVSWTKEEIKELAARIRAALEVSGGDE